MNGANETALTETDRDRLYRCALSMSMQAGALIAAVATTDRAIVNAQSQLVTVQTSNDLNKSSVVELGHRIDELLAMLGSVNGTASP